MEVLWLLCAAKTKISGKRSQVQETEAYTDVQQTFRSVSEMTEADTSGNRSQAQEAQACTNVQRRLACVLGIA